MNDTFDVNDVEPDGQEIISDDHNSIPNSGKLISKMVNDPQMLRYLLEALIVDDLEQKGHGIDLTEVLREVQQYPKEVLNKADETANELLITVNDEMETEGSLRADRSTQEFHHQELTDQQLDFFGDGI